MATASCVSGSFGARATARCAYSTAVLPSCSLLLALRGITHQVPILPRDAHQQSGVIRIQLFRRKIKLQRLGGLQFGVKDIALLDQFRRRIRTDAPCSREPAPPLPKAR